MSSVLTMCVLRCFAILILQDVVAYSSEHEHIAPLRILSFDIECAGRPGIFPDAKIDPVIQIANLVTVNGNLPQEELPSLMIGEDSPIIKNVFVLDKCSHIVGTDVRCYETEKELLKAWKDFVVKVFWFV